MAEGRIDSTFEQMGNAAFRPLFAYLSEENPASSSTVRRCRYCGEMLNTA